MNLVKLVRNTALIIGLVLLTFGMCGLDTKGSGYKVVVVICVVGAVFSLIGLILTKVFQIDDSN